MASNSVAPNRSIDITGQQFGRLVAIEPIGRTASNSFKWRCRCDCGNETTTAISFLRGGRTLSCGCARATPKTYKPHIEDLGQTFGRLTVIERGPSRKNSAAQWYCRCVCGNTKLVRAASLRNGSTQSCGCLNRDMLREHEDLRGRQFGRLTVIERTTEAAGPRRWRCRCQCGAETIVYTSGLKNGKSRSCGCLQSDIASANFRKHNRSRTPIYAIWCGIIARCENNNCKAFNDYGGRGIRICQRWRTAFENFLADVGERPSPEHTLDRVDVNGHYEPGNVRWATRKEQAANKRKLARIEQFTTEELLAELHRRKIIVQDAREIDEDSRSGTPSDRRPALQ